MSTRWKPLLRRLWWRLRIIKASVARKPSEVDLAGVKLRLGAHLTQEIQNHLCAGSYEWPELQAIRHALAPDDVVFELGAGIGFLSAYCAQRIGSERVFTYEANPDLLPHLHDTYRRNHVAPTLEMCLVSEQEGPREFWVRRAFWESSVLPGGPAATRIVVPAKRLDREIERIKPTFLILDIEGGEYELCRHMRFSGVRTIVMEVHHDQLSPGQVEAVKTVLSDAGFQLVREFRYWREWSVLLLQRLKPGG